MVDRILNPFGYLALVATLLSYHCANFGSGDANLCVEISRHVDKANVGCQQSEQSEQEHR